ncbi:MAG: hypothetical protein ABI678_33360, partial [Kofleriaceae bacterium]
YTKSRDAEHREVGEFPEQVPYLEWLASDYRATASCQSCHMPSVDAATAISAIAGTARDGLARHDFRGANVLVLAMLDRHRADLEVTAPSSTLQHAADTTRTFLEQKSARVAISSLARDGGVLVADVDVENLGGHKLPTAYPSRRVWLHVTVRDAAGAIQFESGRALPSGAIDGNANDRDAATFEPHYTEIRSPDQVQIYEAILGDPQGRVTTALLSTTQYLKDNRLLPRGFSKTAASADTAVHGAALGDPDFVGGHDRVRYSISSHGPVTVEIELLYQPIGFRWAHNLARYPAAEPQRFVAYYDEMAGAATVRLAQVSRVVP